MGQVGRLGEEIAASLVGGEIVNDHSEETPFADVVNRDLGIAVQAKMCNHHHAQRPLPKQVIGLFDEIENPYLFNKGVYVFIFYNGVHSSRTGRWGQSKIWSRRHSRGMRRNIIIDELQYIYVLDVKLLRYMADRPEFLKTGAIVHDPEMKPTRDKVLYLTRTFMRGFIERRPVSMELLNTALGIRCWQIATVTPEFRFTGGVHGSFSRKIPVHIVGSQSTVRTVIPILHKPLAPISLGHVGTVGLTLSNPPQ